MRSKLLAVAAISVFTSMATGLAYSQAQMVQAKVAMTDSSAAALATTKRVAISNVMVSFQASVGGDKTNTSGLFAAKSDASSALQMPVMDTQLLATITDDIHQQLKADLQANGFEVLPEATVLASSAYKKIIAMAGISNFSKFANMNGDVVLVGASGLKPYLPYNAETGKFGQPTKSLINDWISRMGGKSSTEGGPSSITIAEIYALPGLDPERQVLPVSGTREALFAFAQGAITYCISHIRSQNLRRIVIGKLYGELWKQCSCSQGRQCCRHPG